MLIINITHTGIFDKILKKKHKPGTTALFSFIMYWVIQIHSVILKQDCLESQQIIHCECGELILKSWQGVINFQSIFK